MLKQEKLSIMILNEQQLFMDGMRYILGQLSLNINYFTAINVDDALKIAHSNSLSLILLDASFIEAQGFQILRLFRETHAHVPVIILSSNSNIETVLLSFELGARGFVHKSIAAESFIDVIKQVLAGNKYCSPHIEINLPRNQKVISQKIEHSPNKLALIAQLTPRQKEVLGCIAMGLSNKEIADSLQITEATTKAHVTAILRILKVSSRLKAAQLLSETSSLMGVTQNTSETYLRHPLTIGPDSLPHSNKKPTRSFYLS